METIASLSSQTEEPTPASMWRALTGRPVTDEFLQWPPDLFAFTDVILRRSEAYRFVLSSHAMEWPPSRFGDWTGAIENVVRHWSEWVENREGLLPTLLTEEWSLFRQRAETPLAELAEGRDWRMCQALLTLHAISDEACAGLGVPLDRSDGKGCVYRARGRELLARTESLVSTCASAVRKNLTRTSAGWLLSSRRPP